MSSTIKQTNTGSLQLQNEDALSVSDLPPPPSYNFDQERNGYTFEDDKRLRTIDPDSVRHQNDNAPRAPAPNQAVFEEEFYESKPFHQRRVCCLSLFWFAVICDICATAVALLGTMGATLKCRANCVDDCNALCNPKSVKGLVASAVIFALLSSAIIVGKLAYCCCSEGRNAAKSQQQNADDPSTA
ncbi:hypothetical protein V8B55DRAFT_1539820 [Mucor lusitanicus]|uniref:Uncharacterized protein n=2 Tax=Mucor circinelloides f. lusitanicus TaxID=29924 RepID=A0A168N9U1_MUCCL|nr:hypothetical protein FB192DRAFT_1387511 [Mucor lusitanicus]OAD05993.1 hypothetical protein MUCCIDRAFT_159685 [Mucor lusitanicus CBS 277.49]